MDINYTMVLVGYMLPMVIVAVGAIYTVRYETLPDWTPPVTYKDIVSMVVWAIVPMLNILISVLMLLHFIQIGWKALDRPIRPR